MRNLDQLNRYRDIQAGISFCGWGGDATCGVFQLPSPDDGKKLMIVASTADGWDHVSVSRPDRCPTWNEMTHIKRKFFKSEEEAMQLHVPASDHINMHPYCLHLWRPQHAEIPRPPGWMVAPV